MRERRRRAQTLIRIQKERIPHLFVGGLDVESEANATILVTNPANGEPIGRCPAANARDVDKAVQTATRAYEDDWATTEPRARAKLLFALAEAIEHEAEDLAILEALQTGKTYREVIRRDVGRAVELLRHFAGWTGKFAGETHPLSEGRTGAVVRSPYPVVASILDWPSPFVSAVEKVGAALAVGSTILVQPPEQAPLTVLKLGELAREISLPAGVINVVTGHGSGAGEALSMHGGVGALTFAGPVDVARRMLLGAAKSNLKPVHFELGDKTPCLLFEDADRKRAIEAISRSIFSARSVLPTAAARVLVHERHYEEVATTLTARAREVLVGDPLDEHNELGPMVSPEHMQRVLAYIELGRREGAKLVAGGQRDVDGTKGQGCYVKPTVFLGVTRDMRIFSEQIAGPVVTVTPFRNEDEAVELANATEYGLAASVWTEDLRRAHRVARRLEAGVVWLDEFGDFDPALPAGGSRLSGSGRRFGQDALQQFTRTRSMYLPSR